MAAPTQAAVFNLNESIEALIKTRIEDIAKFKAEVGVLKKLQKENEKFTKDLHREFDQKFKDLTKKQKKQKKPVNPDKKPSGFASPVVVSDELYTFLKQFGVEHGTPIARTEVTKFITSYIKAHELQHKERKMQILPDDALRVILGEPDHPDPEDPEKKIFVYKQLQRYITRHFPRKNLQLE